MTRLLLLVALPPLVESLVALGTRQTVHLELLQDAPYPRARDLAKGPASKAARRIDLTAHRIETET